MERERRAVEQRGRPHGAIDDIEAFLQERLAVMRNTPAGDQLSEHLGYVTNNKDRMRYVRLRNAGLPVGSGVTESAARTVIGQRAKGSGQRWRERGLRNALTLDRKSTRLNSSHVKISYAVFCLKK